jgi:hypothetical protein
MLSHLQGLLDHHQATTWRGGGQADRRSSWCPFAGETRGQPMTAGHGFCYGVGNGFCNGFEEHYFKEARTSKLAPLHRDRGRRLLRGASLDGGQFRPPMLLMSRGPCNPQPASPMTLDRSRVPTCSRRPTSPNCSAFRVRPSITSRAAASCRRGVSGDAGYSSEIGSRRRSRRSTILPPGARSRTSDRTSRSLRMA